MDSYFDSSRDGAAVDNSYGEVEADDESVFKILLATDIHLGYGEKDPERENDSFLSFEECLQYAKEHEVDFILCGGDLYHENKPSRGAQYRCIELLRRYCLGETPAAFEFLSSREATLSHSDTYLRLNYEDPNLNVAIPVFSINGNHDDPSGQGGLCALDLLAAAGLVNFFGKTRPIDSIECAPLLMRKGGTLLAIYGIGAMRDERLHRMFLQKKVTLLRPKEHADDFFNLLCIHQNRSKHGAKNFIPESFLDDFIDLVFWGHEHESKIAEHPAERNSARDFYVVQPGSTVATSLADGEAVQKHCALLKIRRKEFSITPLPLKTVRQMYIEDLDLSKTSIAPDDPRCMDKIEKKLHEIMKGVLNRAKNERSGHPLQPIKPLVRIKVDASGGYPILLPARFGQHYIDKVANAKEILLFHKRRLVMAGGGDATDFEEGFEALSINLNQLNAHRLEDIITELMEAPENKMSQLKVLSEMGLRRSLEAFVDKEDKEAIGNLMKHQIDRMINFANANPDIVDDFDDLESVNRLLNRFHAQRKGKSVGEEDEEVIAMLQSKRSTRVYNPNDDEQNEEDEDEDDVKPKAKPAARRAAAVEPDDDEVDLMEDDDNFNSTAAAKPKRGGRGSRGGGRGSRGSRAGAASPAPTRGRGRGRGRGAAAAARDIDPFDVQDDFENDDMMMADEPPPPPVARKTAAASSRAKPADIRSMWQSTANNSNTSMADLDASTISQTSQRRLPTSLTAGAGATSATGSGFIDLTGVRAKNASGQPPAKKRPQF